MSLSTEQYEIKKHVYCPTCQSSDANMVYNDHSHCFSCGKQIWVKVESYDEYVEFTEGKGSTKKMTTKEYPPDDLVERRKENKFFETGGNIKKGPWKDRNISKEATIKYGVMFQLDDNKKIERVIFPVCDEEGSLKYQKVRYLTSNGKKSFLPIGSNSSALFGMNVHPPRSKKAVILCEGETDTLSAYDLQGTYCAVVGVTNGTDGAEKQCKANYDYLNSFEEIYICFDKDGEKEQGQKAAKKVARIFPKKAKIIDLGKYNDVTEILEQESNPKKYFTNCYFNAKVYAPTGVLTGASLRELALSNPEPKECRDYPWKGLNDFTYGWRMGEVTVISAPKKVGKTAISKETSFYAMNTYDDVKVGGIFLEDPVDVHTKSYVSLQGNKLYHLPKTEYSQEEYRENVMKMNWDKLVLLDKSYCKSIADVIAKLEWLVRVQDCNYIILDNFMALIDLSQGYGSEREDLNSVVATITDLAEQENVHMDVIAHLNRDGEIYGTSRIENKAHTVINLQRDLENKSDKIKNTTYVTVKANRFSGDTGPCCALLYDKKTGRLLETEWEEEDDNLLDFDDVPWDGDKPIMDNNYG